MNKNRIVELATYITVGLLIWVITPLLAKFIDSFYFTYPGVFARSVLVLLIGAILLIAGIILVVWTIFLFKTKGQGTPNPTLPPRVFVVEGPYRYTRNPMALGGLSTLLGEAAIYFSPTLSALAVIFGLVVYFNAMWVEEPELLVRFGEPYREYLKSVPRFFPNPLKWQRD